MKIPTNSLFVIIIMFFICCDTEKHDTLVTVETNTIIMITSNSAVSGGNVISNGNHEVTARGVCWDTLRYPTIFKRKTNDGAGSGSFESDITGLISNKIYYVRAYAMIRNETAYGNEISFMTTTGSGIPTLSDAILLSFTNNTATCAGTVISNGGSELINRGVCWSLSPSPTIANSKTDDGTEIGLYKSIITGLSENEIYYVRAYASNDCGTAYSNQLNFTTKKTLTDIDGNVYVTVQIGNQEWMVENLRTTRFRNGDAIPNVYGSGVTFGAYCNYGNDTNNVRMFGRLYNWHAVNDNRNIAPVGWRVPSNNDWQVLLDFVGGHTVAGMKLKSTSGWLLSGNGTNDYLFTALPSGFCNYDGTFQVMGKIGLWWTTDEVDANTALGQYMGYLYSSVRLHQANKQNYFSIRCIKNN